MGKFVSAFLFFVIALNELLYEVVFFRPITTKIDRASITKPGQLKLPQAFMHGGSGRMTGPHPGPYSRAGNNHPALP